MWHERQMAMIDESLILQHRSSCNSVRRGQQSARARKVTSVTHMQPPRRNDFKFGVLSTITFKAPSEMRWHPLSPTCVNNSRSRQATAKMEASEMQWQSLRSMCSNEVQLSKTAQTEVSMTLQHSRRSRNRRAPHLPAMCWIVMSVTQRHLSKAKCRKLGQRSARSLTVSSQRMPSHAPMSKWSNLGPAAMMACNPASLIEPHWRRSRWVSSRQQAAKVRSALSPTSPRPLRLRRRNPGHLAAKPVSAPSWIFQRHGVSRFSQKRCLQTTLPARASPANPLADDKSSSRKAPVKMTTCSTHCLLAFVIAATPSPSRNWRTPCGWESPGDMRAEM
mmetsp:Transcript_104753/g.303161  ORF Transcript_104753/g.303161 Transcript_104753/m.303161 type:complete len:334 (-) Transcript_104753:44-1045(-)